jgi:signal transduction histidine kinase
MMGIRNKLLVIISGALLLSLYLNTYIQISLYKDAYNNELDKRITLLHQNLNQRALIQAQNLSNVIAENLASFNLFYLTHLIKDEVAHSEELHQAVLVSEKGKVFVHSNNPDRHQKQYLPSQTKSGSTLQFEIPEHISFREIVDDSLKAKHSNSMLEYRIPIEIGDSNWGDLYLQYSLDKLNHSIAQSIEENNFLQEEQTTKAIYIAAIILLLAFVLIAQLSDRLVEPLVNLSAYAKEIARHNFTKVFSIKVTGKDEISELGRNFVEMAKNLEENYFEQTNYNLRLEEKVFERTKELNTKNEELVEAVRKVEESQQQLIYSEKMAALGQLIAGIAHEINTPLGAISASASNTSESLEEYLTQLPLLLDDDTSPIVRTLNKVLSLAGSSDISIYEALSTREERAIKKDLTQKLSKYHPDTAGQLAEMLLEIGFHDKLDQLRPEIEQPENVALFTLIHSLMSIQLHNSTIHTAIARVSKIVFALKTFSHQDSSGEMIFSDINEGINTVLILYQNQLKQGAEVHKELSELPSTFCYPDELNQVWTNLIHNALQAMNNQGSLTISSKQQNNNIVVAISDTGPGIPENIRDKIFSSFFTTKPAGEGSGLGLSICRQIIDKHQGDIQLESRPGRTTFTVIIPIRGVKAL